MEVTTLQLVSKSTRQPWPVIIMLWKRLSMYQSPHRIHNTNWLVSQSLRLQIRVVSTSVSKSHQTTATGPVPPFLSKQHQPRSRMPSSITMTTFTAPASMSTWLTTCQMVPTPQTLPMLTPGSTTLRCKNLFHPSLLTISSPLLEQLKLTYQPQSNSLPNLCQVNSVSLAHFRTMILLRSRWLRMI